MGQGVWTLPGRAAKLPQWWASSCSDSTQHKARGGPCSAAGTPSLLANAPLSLQVRTADMGGYATSLDFTQAVIAALDV